MRVLHHHERKVHAKDLEQRRRSYRADASPGIDRSIVLVRVLGKALGTWRVPFRYYAISVI